MSTASFPGWALSEAFEKIVPDEFFEDLRRAEASFDHVISHVDTAARRSEIGTGALTAARTLNAASSMHRRAKQNIYDRFRKFALDGSVVVFGLYGDEDDNGEISLIPPQLWHELDGFLENRSAVGKRPDDDPDALLPDTALVGINVFPVLHAPVSVATKLLSSEPLSTVIERFVWEDPEALKIWNDRLKRPGKLPNDTPEISSDSTALVALHIGRKAMLRELTRIELAGKLGLNDGAAGDTPTLYLNVVADRLAALGELIATARIGLIGLDDVSGEKVSIDPVDLEAGRLLLCLGTGDLYRPGDSGGAIRNVRIVEPSAASDLATTPADDDSSGASTEASGIGATIAYSTNESVVEDEGALSGDVGRPGKPPSKYGYRWKEALEIVIGRALRHEGDPINTYTQLCTAISTVMVVELGMRGDEETIKATVRRKTKVHWPWLRAAAGGGD